jgi:uncharacterized protein YndB with AHSA1/START domain
MSDYGEAAGQGSVRFRRRLPGPIERVWEHLTDSKLRSTWFAAGDMELRAGGRLDYVFHNSEFTAPGEVVPERYRKEEGYRFTGTVTRCEPPRVLAWTWDGSEVTFELDPAGDEVLLTLTHVRLASRKERVDVCAGWHVHLDLLRERLRGTTPRHFWRDVDRYEREYDARVPSERP